MTPKTKFLTIAQVLAIHEIVVNRYGGSPGIRDLGSLKASVERAKTTYSKRDLYPTIFEKAAAIMQSIIKNHPFVDGNKRTALTSAGIFLELNGWKMKNTHQEEMKFTLKIDKENLPVKQIAKWLKENSDHTA